MTSNDKPNELAINGGNKVRTTPWPARRLFVEEEKQAVMALFDQAIEKGHAALGYNGPQEEAYCREFAAFLGGGFADGVNSGTTALYVALRALELPPFSEVIVPPITDAGGAMPVPLMGCIPIPADSMSGFYNVNAEQVEARLTERTSAIVVAHIGGVPVDMDPLLELATARGIPVVEDCAQAHGTLYKGRPVGTLGTLASFSTMFGKHHATGGQGGIVFTCNEEIYWRIRRYADRGKPFGLENVQGNVTASLNFNMDELHAAIGRVQLRKLSDIIRRRRNLVKQIAEGCQQSLQTVRLVREPDECESAFWFLVFHVDTDRISVSKDEFVAALVAEGVPVASGYWEAVQSLAPWWQNKAVFGTTGLPWSSSLYQGDPDQDYPLPNAEANEKCHFRGALHEDWTQQEVADLLAALKKVENAFLK